MSATKKHWVLNVFSDSQENSSDTADISWSSSDSNSEDNTIVFSRKRPIATGFLELNHLECRVRNVNETPLKPTINVPPQIPRDEFLESPIISEVQLQESPILTQNNLFIFKEESPIIARNKIVKKLWRNRCKKREVKEEIQDDSDSSQIISNTPTQVSPAKTHFEISQSSVFSQSYDIDPFPSQDSSEVVSDSISGFSGSKELYHQPPPRKKRFKKGSLGHQLNKAVNLQTTSSAIWQHEMYLSRKKGEEILEDNEKSGIEFTFMVIKKWKEYGCTVLQCKYNDDNDNLKKILSFDHSDLENYTNFLIINPSGLCFQPNVIYRIYPPYLTKIVKYELKQTLCLIDCSRFLAQ